MTETGQVCRRFLVRGSVQGVFFRASAREQARRLHLGGWARNLDSGDVEVVARGEAAELDELARWLTVGPPAATVTGVTIETADVETPAVFEVR